ncbi:hypothetical protein [Geodermatophilus sp. URMC 64]
MPDELFRFVQLRGAEPATPQELGPVLRAWSEPSSDFENAVVAAAGAGEDVAAVAREWLAGPGSVEGPLTGLRRLDESLGPVETLTLRGFVRQIRAILDVEAVVDNARLTAQDALIAVALLSELAGDARGDISRLVVVAAVAQQALRWEGEVRGGEEEEFDTRLRELLDTCLPVLSPAVSALLVQEAAADRIREEIAPDEEGVEILEPERIRRDRDAALAELVAVLVNPDDALELRPALEEDPPDELPRRLRPTESVTLSAPQVLLQGAVRDRLSEGTRALLDRVAPGVVNAISAIDAVERASAVPGRRSARAADGVPDPTGGFPIGYGALRLPVAGMVRPPGIGELLSVRREHDEYVLGTITYIENVLSGETRERTHRRLDRTEEQTFFETERTVVDERDLQSTERFSLETETRNEVNAQVQLQVGAQVSGSYGTVQASASFGYTSSSATSNATRTATTTARETVDRAVKRVAERTLERRQRITIREIEETNRHQLTNGDSQPNKAGIYRFVDDVQEVGAYSYGLRLMFEVHVPEPGAYLRWRAGQGPQEVGDPEPAAPALPEDGPLTSPDQLDAANYRDVARRYSAAVEPPPPLFTTVAASGRQEYQQNTPGAATPAFLFYRSEDRLEVPDGYRAVRANGVMHASAWKFDVWIAVGAATFHDANGDAAMPLPFSVLLADEDGTVPLAFTINNAWGFAYTVEIVCQRTDRLLEQWQIRTFNAIMQAYEAQHSAWEERRRATSISSAGIVTGQNPALNRQVERAELKKSVISLLSGSPLRSFGAIVQASPEDEPLIDDAAAVGQSAVISFYEQAFEWENIVYTLYPYFWGRHTAWPYAASGDGVDVLHDAFLEAGLARAVVPVRPGFEQVALWFFATGQVWYGGAPPPISSSDPLYVSIAAELVAAAQAEGAGVLQGSTWPVTTPTNLIYLQPGPDLNP